MAEFSGKAAIVTGAASGISWVIAPRFAEAGSGVVIADIDDDLGSTVAGELVAKGLSALYLHTDVRHSAQVDVTVAATVEHFGGVDIVVHGAGVGVHNHIVRHVVGNVGVDHRARDHRLVRSQFGSTPFTGPCLESNNSPDPIVVRCFRLDYESVAAATFELH